MPCPLVQGTWNLKLETLIVEHWFHHFSAKKTPPLTGGVFETNKQTRETSD